MSAKKRHLQRHLPAVATLLLLAACASTPSGPDVLALPGSGKSLEQFNGDDVSCRQYALAQLGGKSPGSAASERAGSGAADASWSEQQKRYDFAYVQCMYAKGHRIPVIGRGY